MQIENNNFSFNLNNKIVTNTSLVNSEGKKEDPALNTSIDQSSLPKTNTISMQIQSSNTKLASIQISNKNTQEKLAFLNDIKSTLEQSKQNSIKEVKKLTVNDMNNLFEQFSTISENRKNDVSLLKNESSVLSIEEVKDLPEFNWNDYIKKIPPHIKKAELENASYFLNPNQKFYSTSEQKAYLKRMDSAQVNVSLLPQNEHKLYFENFGKAILGTLDKKSEFDDSLNTLYGAKRVLEDVTSLKERFLNSENISTSSNLTNRKTFTFNENFTLSEEKPLNQKSTASREDNEADNKVIKKQINLLEKANEKLLLASNEDTTKKEKESLYEEIKALLKDFNSEVISDLLEGFDEFASSTSYYDSKIKKGMSYDTNTKEYAQYKAAYVIQESFYTQLKNGTFASTLSKRLDELSNKNITIQMSEEEKKNLNSKDVNLFIEDIDKLMNLLNESRNNFDLLQKKIQRVSVDFMYENNSDGFEKYSSYIKDSTNFTAQSILEKKGSLILSQAAYARENSASKLIV